LDRSELEVSSFVGFHIGGMYQSNSLTLPPYMNFETPFAFYNFAPEETRLAHLVVRGSHTPPKDPFRGLVARGVPKTDFRYSWKTFNNNRWRYGLHLAGTYPFDEKIKIGTEEFYSVAPDILPEWIVEKDWPVVSFVEAVEGFHGSEGIYFYSTQARPIWPWLIGTDNTEPEFLKSPYLQEGTVLGDSPDESLPSNFRGEFNAAYNEVPSLYYSPIDNRVHLYKAQEGIWNLGSGKVLRSFNYLNSPYTNAWIRESVPEQVSEKDPIEEGQSELDAVFLPKALRGNIESALYAIDDYLVYVENNQELIIRKTEFELSSLNLDPPHNESSWQAHKALLEPLQGQEGNPFNMKAWLEPFVGPSLVISNMTVMDLELSDESLNVVFTVLEGASLTNEFAELDLSALSPSTYVLRYDLTSKSWEFEAAQLNEIEAELTLTEGALAIDQVNNLDLALHNPSNVDESGPAILLIGDSVVETWENLSLSAGETISEDLTWIPYTQAVENVVLNWDEKQLDLGTVIVSSRARTPGIDIARMSYGAMFKAILFLATAFFFVIFFYRRVWI